MSIVICLYAGVVARTSGTATANSISPFVAFVAAGCHCRILIVLLVGVLCANFFCRGRVGSPPPNAQVEEARVVAGSGAVGLLLFTCAMRARRLGVGEGNCHRRRGLSRINFGGGRARLALALAVGDLGARHLMREILGNAALNNTNTKADQLSHFKKSAAHGCPAERAVQACEPEEAKPRPC